MIVVWLAAMAFSLWMIRLLVSLLLESWEIRKLARQARKIREGILNGEDLRNLL